MPNNETKIVKASPKQDGTDTQIGASKVTIKAVNMAELEAQKKKAAAKKSGTRRTAAESAEKKEQAKTKAPVGTGLPKKAPAGTPMPKSKVIGTAMPKSAVPQKKNVEEAEAAKEAAETAVKEAPAKEAAPVKEETAQQASPAETPKPEKKPAVKEAPVASFDEKPIGIKIIKKAEKPAEAPKKEAVKEEPKPVKEEAPAEVKTEKKEKAETPAPKTEAADKPAEEAKPAPKKEEPKPVKKEEKPAPDYSEFTKGIGIKVIRRAADEPKPAPKQDKPAPKKNDRPARDGKPNGGNGKFANKDGQKRPFSKDGKPANGQGFKGKDGDRKPKEFIGKKDGNSDTSPRRKNGPVTDAKGEKVVAYTSSQNGDNRGKKGKSKDRDKDNRKNMMFDEIPSDLSRTKKNKHSKYKEAKPVEEEVLSEEVVEAMQTGGYVINVPITLGGFCEQTESSTSKAIMALMKMGIMANINQNLDEETAVLLGMELGITVAVKKAEEIVEEEGIDNSEDRESDLQPRPPVITVMGHVDHGKTSILDAIRNTNVTAGEAGGITQHIGASEVIHNGKRIVFLDTPGHEAFTAMRARGAQITDIAVLVVAADDSVMPQTIESISHAKAANVPIIVAMNKMDKPQANPDQVKRDLADNGILVEDWGGETICVPCSAKTGMGISELLDMILIQAEMLELKANPNRLAQGSVIEARLDKNKGPIATVLVTNGTLHAGAAVVAGLASGRVRVMNNSKGEPIKKAGPATAVEITGLTEVPEAGDEFYMVKDEKTAREITEKRKEKMRSEVLAKNSSMSLEKFFSQMKDGEVQDLNIIIKADVQGSIGALEQSIEKMENENVKVKIIHSGVGTITEGDVMLAGTSNAIIIGFNVRPSSAVEAQAEREGVEIRTYRVIYEIIDDLEAAMKGMLAPELKEVVLGKVEVRETYKISGVGVIAGAYVIEGKVTRGAQLRLVRDGIVIHEGEIGSLKRFKDDVKEVATGYECGLGIDKYNDIKVGDIIEAFKMEEVKKE